MLAGAPGRTVLRTDGVLLGKYDIIIKIIKRLRDRFRIWIRVSSLLGFG